MFVLSLSCRGVKLHACFFAAVPPTFLKECVNPKFLCWLLGWNIHCILYLADSFLFNFHACAGFVRAFMWVCKLAHIYASIQTDILVCMGVCVYNNECAICPSGSKRPTPAGDRQTASLSSGKVRTESEMGWNREQRGLTLPPDIVISSFSHHIGEEGNNTLHTCSLGALAESSTVSSFSKQKKEKNQRAERRAGEGSTGWKI